jgi:hypothetical protein
MGRFSNAQLVKHTSYDNGKRNSGHGPKEAVITNVTYSFHNTPISINLNGLTDVASINLKSALLILITPNSTSTRVCKSVKAFLSYLNSNYQQYIVVSKHEHDSKSTVVYDGGSFCNLCASNLLIMKSFKENGIMYEGMNDQNLAPVFQFKSKIVVNQICHGLLTFGLFKARTTMNSVPVRDVKYSPHNITSKLLQTSLSTRSLSKMDFNTGIFKSISFINFDDYAMKLIITCFADMWRMLSYSVHTVTIGGSVHFNLPKVFAIKDLIDDKIHYHVGNVSEEAIDFYYKSSGLSVSFMPVIKLYINGIDAGGPFGFNGIYDMIASYMVGYCSMAVRGENEIMERFAQ